MRLLAPSFLCAALCAVTAVYAAESSDFSGSYSLVPTKESQKSGEKTVRTLAVVQSEHSIDVTAVENGRTTTYHCPLDGQDGVYISSTGIKGRCKAKLGRKDLVLETFVTTVPVPNGPPIQMHTKEKWKLSADLKTLRIHVDVDSPQSPINIVDPWTDTYSRN